MDRAMGCKAVEATEAMAAAAKAMAAAAKAMAAAAKRGMAAAAAAAAEAFRHCRYISRKAERTDSNAGRKNSYGSFDGGFHGRFSMLSRPPHRDIGAGAHLKLFAIQLFSPIAGF
jgi:hypothetical protein